MPGWRLVIDKGWSHEVWHHLRMEPFALTGERVRLAVPTLADADVLTACLADSSVLRWIGAMPDPYTRDDAVYFIEQVTAPGWRDETQFNWSIREKPDGWRGDDPEPPVFGGVGLTGLSSGSAEIGWWLATAARGRGLAAEAARLVLDWAFDSETLALQRVYWRAEVGNWASRRLAWNLGFRVEGCVRAEIVNRGERRDAWVGTLLPGDPRQPNEPWPANAPMVEPPPAVEPVETT